MASSAITHVSLFEIGKDGDNWPVYNYRVDLEVEPGTHIERIRELVAAGRRPANAYTPDISKRQPARYLDIEETRNVGTCLYAFLLGPNLDGGQRQLFVDGRPFIHLPLNSERDPETFLTDFQVDGESRQLAFFVCDLEGTRSSRLATELRPTGREPKHAPPRVLNLPFCFNVVDPLLKASPWVVPEQSDDDDPTHAHFFTHGGVHPATVAFVSVAI
jgi:hypothetical protein